MFYRLYLWPSDPSPSDSQSPSRTSSSPPSSSFRKSISLSSFHRLRIQICISRRVGRRHLLKLLAWEEPWECHAPSSDSSQDLSPPWCCSSGSRFLDSDGYSSMSLGVLNLVYCLLRTYLSCSRRYWRCQLTTFESTSNSSTVSSPCWPSVSRSTFHLVELVSVLTRSFVTS